MIMWASKKKSKLYRLFSTGVFVLILASEATALIFPHLVNPRQISKIAAVVIIIKLFFEIPPKLIQYSRLRREGMKFSAQLVSLFPKWLVGLFLLECAQQRAFLCWVQRKPAIKNYAEGERFSHHKKSQYSTLIIILLILLATDIPISTLMISLALDDPQIQKYIHIFLIISTIYTISWIVSDRHLINSTYHIVGLAALHLQVGARFKAQIPWSTCKDAILISQNKELKDSRKIWLNKQGFQATKTIFCTPFDQPNVALTLDDLASSHIEKYNIKISGVQYVLIYVDEPRNFIEAIRQKLKD